MSGTVDVACVGPAFLDLTFEGLDELPGPGQERHALELHATPGGAAITALGLARLGLRTALLAPLGRDVAGRTVRPAASRPSGASRTVRRPSRASPSAVIAAPPGVACKSRACRS